MEDMIEFITVLAVGCIVGTVLVTICFRLMLGVDDLIDMLIDAARRK